MSHEILQGRIIRIRELVDLLMQPYMSETVILVAYPLWSAPSYRWTKQRAIHTGRLDERVVQPVGEQRFWELPEPQLEHTGNDIDVG